MRTLAASGIPQFKELLTAFAEKAPPRKECHFGRCSEYSSLSVGSLGVWCDRRGGLC